MGKFIEWLCGKCCVRENSNAAKDAWNVALRPFYANF